MKEIKQIITKIKLILSAILILTFIFSCDITLVTPWQFVDTKEVDILLSSPYEIDIDNKKLKMMSNFTKQFSYNSCKLIFCDDTYKTFYPARISFRFKNVKEESLNNNNNNGLEKLVNITGVWVLNKGNKFYMKVSTEKITYEDVSPDNYSYFRTFRFLLSDDYRPSKYETLVIEFNLKNKTYLIKSLIDN